MPCRTTQDRQVIVESSDKMWPTGKGNVKPHQSSCLENPIDSMKRQKDTTPENDPPGQKMSNMLLGKNERELLIAPERMKRLGQSRNNAQLWMYLVVKLKSSAVKNNIT